VLQYWQVWMIAPPNRTYWLNEPHAVLEMGQSAKDNDVPLP